MHRDGAVEHVSIKKHAKVSHSKHILAINLARKGGEFH